MIAERFRSLWWAAFAMVAGLMCYMVTQHVAGQRLALEKADKRIRIARLAVRALETELGTRASMAQLEKWNVETLALRAPKPEQYIVGVEALASLGGAVRASPADTAAAAAIAQVAYHAPVPTPTQGAVTQVAYHAPAPAPAAPMAAAPPAQPLLRDATYVRPARDRAAEAPRKVAMISTRDPLSAGTLAALDRIATTEQSHSGTGGQ